jgi:acyl-CoA thioester hydrolase
MRTFEVDESLLAGYPVVVEIPVAWGEMDFYRHVNNVVYFRYFENARLEYFRRLDWFDFERETGIGPILHSTQARFRKPLAYPDTVSAAVRIASMGDDRFTMEYSVVSHNLGAVAADGQGIIVTYHYGEARKVLIPEEIRHRIEGLEGKKY